jgi:hypothetical protein
MTGAKLGYKLLQDKRNSDVWPGQDKMSSENKEEEEG